MGLLVTNPCFGPMLQADVASKLHAPLSTSLRCESSAASESPKLGYSVPSAQPSVTATGGDPAVFTEPLEACPRHRET